MSTKNKLTCREKILKAHEAWKKRRLVKLEEKDYVPTKKDPDMAIILEEEVEG